MKHLSRLVILSLLTAVFLSCTGFFDLGEEKITDFSNPDNVVVPTTFIVFDNYNNFAVDVFISHTREGEKTPVPASASSLVRPWFPAEEFTFYFTYYLPVSGKTIPYIPPNRFIGTSSSTLSININVTTTIPIPQLSERIPNNAILFDEAYLIIKNNNTSGIEILSGNSPIRELDGQNIINPGATGIFRFNQNTTAVGYSINVRGGGRMSLPSSIITFQSGYIYEVEVTNTQSTLVTSKQLKLDDLY